MKLSYIGIKQTGKSFRVVNSKLLKLELDNLPDGRYRLTVDKYRKNKSNPQLGYLFAVIYPLVLRALNDAGWEFTTVEEVDEYCKSMFSSKEIINRHSGEILDIPGLKRDMTTTEMMTYIDAIRNWCSEYLSVIIPEPNEQFTVDFK
jgi:hypothetical protein